MTFKQELLIKHTTVFNLIRILNPYLRAFWPIQLVLKEEYRYDLIHHIS